MRLDRLGWPRAAARWRVTPGYPVELFWASTDGTSINSWMHEAIEREVFRRRCVAHGQWMDANPAIRDELLAQAEAAAQEIDDLRCDGGA